MAGQMKPRPVKTVRVQSRCDDLLYHELPEDLLRGKNQRVALLSAIETPLILHVRCIAISIAIDVTPVWFAAEAFEDDPPDGFQVRRVGRKRDSWHTPYKFARGTANVHCPRNPLHLAG